MQIKYTKKESVAVDHPPVEVGTYAVLRRNGKDETAVWDGKQWSGISDVMRYSGAPALLSDDVREQYRQNIRAGLEVPDGLEQRTIAKNSALRLARHRAVTMGKAKSDEDQLFHIKDMVGLFKVANTLGISYSNEGTTESNATDRALLAWGTAQIRERDPEWFDHTGNGVETIHGIKEWLDNR